MNKADDIKREIPFELFVQSAMLDRGVTLTHCTTTRDQMRYGDFREHWEVKHDHRMAETGNLCIEFAERAKSPGSKWRPSGIFAPQEPLEVLAIGDYDRFYVLPCQRLRDVVVNRCEQFPDTSIPVRRITKQFPIDDDKRAYLMPIELASEWGECVDLSQPPEAYYHDPVRDIPPPNAFEDTSDEWDYQDGVTRRRPACEHKRTVDKRSGATIRTECADCGHFIGRRFAVPKRDDTNQDGETQGRLF